MPLTMEFTDTLVVTTCWCGINYAVPEDLKSSLVALSGKPPFWPRACAVSVTIQPPRDPQTPERVWLFRGGLVVVAARRRSGRSNIVLTAVPIDHRPLLGR